MAFMCTVRNIYYLKHIHNIHKVKTESNNIRGAVLQFKRGHEKNRIVDVLSPCRDDKGNVSPLALWGAIQDE